MFLQLLLELVEFVVFLVGVVAGESVSPGHEVGWEFPKGGSGSPAEGLDPDLGQDPPDRHWRRGWILVRADDGVRVRRLGEVGGAAFVGS